MLSAKTPGLGEAGLTGPYQLLDENRVKIWNYLPASLKTVIQLELLKRDVKNIFWNLFDQKILPLRKFIERVKVWS